MASTTGVFGPDRAARTSMGGNASNAEAGIYGPRVRYASGGANVHNMAAPAIAIAGRRAALRNRNAVESATPSNIVRTGQSSVPPTVRTKSGMIGPGTTIQIENASAISASVTANMSTKPTLSSGTAAAIVRKTSMRCRRRDKAADAAPSVCSPEKPRQAKRSSRCRKFAGSKASARRCRQKSHKLR